ncbi:nucleotide exchange factor GrpE [Candidatus Nanohalovita haloferacivicina]|uniref:nucleotide exchange factor GrpE n=1 Tax=Candidatus Nanohalovita haloferacivicina TaxID=2978046 RepID=UPI00325FB842|nr:Molecular chaperone GrpE (heat shock protein) [Candidatus Nanohalobia archaeon BNXNv]
MSYEELSREQLEEALQEIEEELAEVQEDRDEKEELAKKVKADFENYKKKEQERKDRWAKQAQQKLAEDLIEVLDNLERAILSADEDSTVVQGVKMVSDQLYETLEKKGLQKIDAEGEEFDPELHKAVETETGQHNQVLRQKRKGYMFDDQIIREAEVVVGKEEE